MARTGRRPSCVSPGDRRLVKRCPSKRTTPSAVPTQRYPSVACPTSRTTLLGRPSSDCHERARYRNGALTARDRLKTNTVIATSAQNRVQFVGLIRQRYGRRPCGGKD